MKLIRDAELYLPKRTERALRAVAEMLSDHYTPADELADQIICEQLELRYPGLFGMIDACTEAYNATLEENKKRAEVWQEQRKAKP